MRAKVSAVLHVVSMVVSLSAVGVAQNVYVLSHASSANKWMTDAIPLSLVRDNAPSEVRKTRDDYFDHIIGQPAPLTPDSARASHLAPGGNIGIPADFPGVDNRQIVIGTFTSFTPILSSSQKAIYTEVLFTSEEIFEKTQPSVASDRYLTVIIPGGTVITRNGLVLSFLTDPRPDFIQPGRRYILILSYHAKGDFNVLIRAWDISSSLVKPGINTSKSPLLGLSVESVISLFRSKFNGH